MRVVCVKKGQLVVAEEQAPGITSSMVRVRTQWSLISAGTESRMIQDGRESQGSFSLGYQAVGLVEEVGSEVSGLQVGDWVACYGGPYVRHAQILAVPRNLVAKLPQGVDPREAAFCGLGVISIHGLRLAELQLGEVMVVQGLGVIGQILVQLGRAAGLQVLASDPDPTRLEAARQAGADGVSPPEGLEQMVAQWTRGQGADAVLCAAGSHSPELAKQAVRVLGHGGRFVAVGVIPLDLPFMELFSKEIEVMVSRAGGPGRYDSSYEREGVDYPRQYVRWTEGRNLEEFIRLLDKKLLSLQNLISHEFPLDEALAAYQMILEGSTQGWLGIVLDHRR